MSGQCIKLLPLGVEFDAFLFAPIYDDKQGMTLSVVSAFARLDLDPWEEAAILARLPVGSAIVRLASTLGGLPAGLRSYVELHTVSMRLVALLHRKTTAEPPASQHVTVPLTPKTKYLAALGGAFMIIMIIFSFVTATWPSGSQPRPVTSTKEAGAPSPSPYPALLQVGQ